MMTPSQISQGRARFIGLGPAFVRPTAACGLLAVPERRRHSRRACRFLTGGRQPAGTPDCAAGCGGVVMTSTLSFSR